MHSLECIFISYLSLTGSARSDILYCLTLHYWRLNHKMCICNRMTVKTYFEYHSFLVCMVHILTEKDHTLSFYLDLMYESSLFEGIDDTIEGGKIHPPLYQFPFLTPEYECISKFRECSFRMFSHILDESASRFSDTRFSHRV